MWKRLAGGGLVGLVLGVPVGRELAIVLTFVLHFEQFRPFPSWMTYYASWGGFVTFSLAMWTGFAYFLHCRSQRSK